MKAREILNFMLTNYVSAEYAGIIEVEKGEDASQYFAELCGVLQLREVRYYSH